MLTIGGRLKSERSKKGLSQSALGEIVGAAKRTVIDWEKDATSPTATQLAAMAGAGIDVLYILVGESPVSPTEPALSDRSRLQVAISAVEEGLAETRRKLAPDKRAELILAAYDLLRTSGQSRDNIIRLVRTAA